MDNDGVLMVEAFVHSDGEMKIVGCNHGDGDPPCHGVVDVVYAGSVCLKRSKGLK